MSTTTAPIKRSPYIVNLSKDHHDALLFVWKIRQGIKRNVTPERISSYVTFFNDHHLKEHFREEEEILFSYLPAGDELVKKACDDHDEIEFLLSKVSSVHSYNFLALLADELEGHVRFEERVLFNHIQETMSEEQLKEAAERLGSSTAGIEDWTDEFWKGTLN